MKIVEQAANEYQAVYKLEGGMPTAKLKKAIFEYSKAIWKERKAQEKRGVK